MGKAVDDLLDILELEQLEVNLFRGISPDEERQRVFGGQVAAQALVAAGRTVDADRIVHSLHAYFLRPGDPQIPIIYDVDRIRDGKSFTTRRVVAIQHGRAIFNLRRRSRSQETGPEHQYPMPDAPDPETLPTIREALEPFADRFPEQFLEWIRRDRPDRLAFAPLAALARSRRRAYGNPNRTRGSAPTAGCPTIRCCTRAWSPTRRTSRSLTLR